MKIVVIEFAGFGGRAHDAFQLCRGLSNAGADVTLITRDDYELVMLSAPFRIEQTIGPTFRRWRASTLRRVHNRLRAFREWSRLIRRVEALRPDAVVLGQPGSRNDYWPLLQLRRKARFLAGLTHHTAATGFLWRRMYGLFDRIFVHSERDRARLHDAGLAEDSRIAVLPRGNAEIFSELADPSLTASALRRQLGIDDGRPVVLLFGTLTRHKGVSTLVEAFARLTGTTAAHLLIAGPPLPGFDLQEQIELAESLGLGDVIVWIPEYIPAEHVVAWMQLASVMALPYRDVAHPGSLHLAQTYGVPVVASAAPVLTDVIEDGVSGLLVESDDSDAWAAALTRLLEDPQLARRLGDRLAADARARCSWDGVARAMLDQLRG